jgi:multiple sugar transport system substrate-binding protein
VKYRWLAALAAGLLFAVTACGSGGGDSGPVTVTYAVWNKDQMPGLQQVVTEFEKSHPNIHVQLELTPFDQYWTKLQTSAGSGSAPDVFWMNGPNAQLYESNGMLLPLSDRIKKDGVDLAMYQHDLVSLYQYDGQQFGVPRDFDTVGLWYNKELFDAAGVPYPNASWTWADLQRAAQQLTNPGKGVYGVAAALMNQENYYNTIPQAGGSVISKDGKHSGYDDPATIAGMGFWTDLIKQGLSPSLQQMTDTAPLQLFQSGKVAMYYGGSWRAIALNQNDYTKNRVDVAPLPAGKQQAVVIHGLANVVYAKSKHPDQAWELAKFLSSAQAADILAQTGTVIPAYQGTQDAWVKSMPQFHLQVFIDALKYTVPYPISKNTAAWQADEKKFLTQAWADTTDIATAARNLATAMNADLAKEAG